MIVKFLEGTFPDYNNRFLSDIWNYDDYEIEKVHNFIQWIFPLDTVSKSVIDAPVLMDDEILDISQSELALHNLIRSKIWFLNFLKRTDNWLTPKNHNHKRISRMIRSLRLLHSGAEARVCLEQVTEIASARGFYNKIVIDYWNRC